MKFLLIGLLVFIVFMATNRLLAGDIIPAQEAASRLETGNAVLIDVREPGEWASTGVAAPAVLLSLSDLRGERTHWKSFLAENKDKELILYCRSGNRSGIAARILAKEGYQVTNAGGFKHWQSANLPIRHVSN